ncbi:hypothetical protein HF086_003322 [Spodoptera exigua]|uniref:Retrotransposon gag domain-containing protein n=1 Tax=Spodoptera exigua TaxID=7107 RepID=A0A922MZ10_SPOEX|nr:hypothetical protein HF086_003322 [Spodoptera exigua]
MSISELQSIYNKLKDIKDYLVKVGPARRQKSDTVQNKIIEAQVVYSRLEFTSSDIRKKIENSEISADSLLTVNKLINDIHTLYNKILNLVICKDDSDSKESNKLSKMASDNFDLKSAIALLPVMTGQEHVTLQIIDSIQLYSSMLNENGKKQLIEFVLKTRLTSSAKLRLKSSYSSVDVLIADMRKYLVPKKSSVAIQSQMFNTKQGHRSIEKYGAELERLFVDLTIAQADGNDEMYQVLLPKILEKIAIKRFADGLSNSRLSTIIASRSCNSLSETIRTAIDEQLLRPDDEQSVMRMKQNNYKKYNNNFSRNNFRPNNRNFQPQHVQSSYKSRVYYNNGASRGPQHRGCRTRGPSSNRGTYNRDSYKSVAHASQQQHDDIEDKLNSEFFRPENE